jgi:class 3 adenylate cyclase
MPDPPIGTVTSLFTDIEGSAALWEQDQAAMRLKVRATKVQTCHR